jgi:hypothetical protein
MKHESDHYVYAYFDPRNYEMFYVGQGKGSRKNAHRPNKVGTEKERQIHEIERAGQKPLIKIVAANLTEDQAFLVEKALIWRSGKWLTNISGGRFTDKFRPPDSLHLSLPDFDSVRGVYAVNVTAAPHRHWDDMRKYGFLAAGYGRAYSAPLERLDVGDIAAAFMAKRGYLGIGRVTKRAVRVNEFRINGRPLLRRMLKGRELFHDAKDANQCEYLVKVKWIKTLPIDDGRFVRKAGLFAPRPIVASLSGQPKTLHFLEEQLSGNFEKL